MKIQNKTHKKLKNFQKFFQRGPKLSGKIFQRG